MPFASTARRGDAPGTYVGCLRRNRGTGPDGAGGAVRESVTREYRDSLPPPEGRPIRPSPTY
ncbi:hypothetical protein MTP06_46000 [Streptomyces sp. PLM4]|nr:hypothetical protein MTP02_14280 [Streptomyces albus]BDH71151.1 hypothetical protein MTP06_46000 [Streptomyces sp. PLM4]